MLGQFINNQKIDNNYSTKIKKKLIDKKRGTIDLWFPKKRMDNVYTMSTSKRYI